MTTKTRPTMSQMSYRLMDHAEVQGYDKWTPEELVAFLRKAGQGDYGEVFLKHKISGRLVPLLTDETLKEMGVTIVGDRLRLMALIQSLAKRARYDSRTKVLWEGKEQLYFTNLEKALRTCCGCFPDDPSKYKLTSRHLKIVTVNPARIGPIRLCCCFQYSINNIDLTKVNDVDVLGEAAPCCQRSFCCAQGREHIEISTPDEVDGKVVLLLPQGEGERVCNMILQQVEETQIMERD